MNIPETLLDMDGSPSEAPYEAPSEAPHEPDLPEIGDDYTVDQDILDSIWTEVVSDEPQQHKRPGINIRILCKKKVWGVSKKRQRKIHYTISETGLQCSHSIPKRICPDCMGLLRGMP